jgi:hypothetical protein
MNIAETYFEKLKKGRVIVHAKELAVLRGGMAYRFPDGSILHIGPHADAVGIKPAKAYPDADALLSDPDLPLDPRDALATLWSHYDRDCSTYLDSLVEGLPDKEREKMATSLPHEGMMQIALHADTIVLPEGPRTHSLADVLAFLNGNFEEVKALFASKGADDAHTRPGFYFFCEDCTYLIDLRGDFDPGKGTIKAMCREFIRDFAHEHDAYGVAIMADSWVASPEHHGWPSDDPNRQEALGYHMRLREDKAWEKHSIYQRQDGEIVWGESSEGEIPPTP